MNDHVTKDKIILWRSLKWFTIIGIIGTTNPKMVKICPIYNTSREDVTALEDSILTFSKSLKPST